MYTMNIYACTHAPRYTPDNPNGYAELDRFRRSALNDRFGVHHLVDNPGNADMILYVKAARPDCKDILNDPMYRTNPSKCFLFEAADNPFPYLPGVYACIHRLCYSQGRTRTGFYQKISSNIEPLVPPGDAYDYLCSFMGRFETHPVRSRLASLHSKDILIENMSCGSSHDIDLVNMEGHNYTELMAKSAFVLCPRGYGVSTFRLFEAMRLGRCPVIISDGWVPPVGPRWETCSIRIRECDIRRLPAILESRLDEAITLGRTARIVWDEWFSEFSSFHRIIEWCLEIDRCRRLPEIAARKIVLWKKPIHKYARWRWSPI